MKACWAGYFERLYQADPPAVELDVRGVTIPVADTPINCGPPSLVETQAAVNQLNGGKAPGILASMLNSQGRWRCCTHVVACSSVLCLERRHHPN